MDTLVALRSFVADVVKDLAPSPSSSLEYLTTAEAAERTRVTAGTVRRWIAQGRLSEHRVGDKGGLRIARAELDDLLQGHKRAPRRAAARLETPDAHAARLLVPARPARHPGSKA